MVRRIGIQAVEKVFGRASPAVEIAKTLDTRGPQEFNAKSTAANGAVESWEAAKPSRLLLRDDPTKTAAAASLERLLHDSIPAKTAEVRGTRVQVTVTPAATSLPVSAFGSELRIAAELAVQHGPAGCSEVTMEGIGAAAYADQVFAREAYRDMVHSFRELATPTRQYTPPPEADVALTSAADPVQVRFQVKHGPLVYGKPSADLSYVIKTGVPGALVAVTGAFDQENEAARNRSDGHRTVEVKVHVADNNGDLTLPIASSAPDFRDVGAAVGNGIIRHEPAAGGGEIVESGPVVQSLRVFRPGQNGTAIEPLFALDVALNP